MQFIDLKFLEAIVSCQFWIKHKNLRVPTHFKFSIMLYKNFRLFLLQKVLIKSELSVFNPQEILRIIKLLVFFPWMGMSISLKAGDKKIIWIWLLTVGCLDELKQVVLALKKKKVPHSLLCMYKGVPITPKLLSVGKAVKEGCWQLFQNN